MQTGGNSQDPCPFSTAIASFGMPKLALRDAVDAVDARRAPSTHHPCLTLQSPMLPGCARTARWPVIIPSPFSPSHLTPPFFAPHPSPLTTTPPSKEDRVWEACGVCVLSASVHVCLCVCKRYKKEEWGGWGRELPMSPTFGFFFITRREGKRRRSERRGGLRGLPAFCTPRLHRAPRTTHRTP